MAALLDWLIQACAGCFPAEVFLSDPLYVRALLGIILVSLNCGMVGSLVVGNRMAFFSDALAHCVFAGVSLGLLSGYFAAWAAAQVGRQLDVFHDSTFYHLVIPLIMVVFGILVGIGIAFVREKTSLASDTVIGVFYAGAIGFGAMLMQALQNRRYLPPENFIFGEPLLVATEDLLLLGGLTLVTVLLLLFMYNSLLFTSFNQSLAKSRRIPVRLCNYLFIILLALIVNLCLKTVGALLINAFLVVPAATAANVSRNMIQQFWLTLLLSLTTGVTGVILSIHVQLPDVIGANRPLSFGPGGPSVVLSVMLFFLSMAVAPRFRGREAE